MTGEPDATGILLVNLGTPDAPSPRALRRYLREFLSDRRVVALPRALWWPILYTLILSWRPRRSARAYAKIWTAEGSPLLVNAQAQAAALREALAPRPVELGMCYGRPSIARGLAELRARNCRRIVVVPAYPQSAAATTGAAFDAVARELARWRDVPALRFAGSYYSHPGYIAALAASVREFRAAHGAGEKLLMSFHGLPQTAVEAGDPYEKQCRATAAALADALQLPADGWAISFQSRLGAARWIQPYTMDTVRAWGRAGIKTIDVICPGFAADCLETLEEIALRNAEYFREAGGKTLRYIPALNARPDHIKLLAELATAA